jgi:DNA-binding CsgD family transcriptional regulator
MLAFVRFRQERLDEAVEFLYQAAACSHADPALRSEVELDLAFVHLSVSLDHEPARPHAAAAVEYAERAADRGLLAAALAVRTIVEFLVGSGLDEESLARALSLENEATPMRLEMRPTLVAGFLAGYVGDLDHARELLQPLRRRLLDRGEETELPLLSIHLAWLECTAGNTREARLLSDESLELAAVSRSMQAHALGFAALLDAYVGDERRCLEHVDAALTALGGAENCLVLEWTGAARGLLELSRGDAGAAAEALEPLTSFFESRELVDPVHLSFLPEEIEALVSLGKLERAERLTELLVRSGDRFRRAAAQAAGARCRGLVKAGRGDLVGARADLMLALARVESLPMPFEAARTLLVLGQIERRLKHKTAARASLERSLVIFTEIDAQLWAERATAEIERVGVRRDPDELTSSEQRVAELAAAGLTNREIAATAFMSEKTVEANLSRAYRKLGIRSRAELGLRLQRVPEFGRG